ncbi:hypothetical protein MJO29_014396 [Puccinia striiformis f. sp. tritici]|uniref:hypothetical protein n=1 Tax=Puccinia striiformis f. sp. tritici TaxID=168172 RepID=UPI0020084D0A|nr:hypothetical protein Pst134EA_026996 [Puccinia striiformis f. sp. tritici]KAH9450294.1 hypothetical protein Pst134EA_026996 [Puccinia striiformis f. sp. tritici]KAI7939660.1 hypothetical protein MJO29_014396 [Puccinia striiformis f. sp. tritici]KAI9629996.1 hypothetical protein KEM48_012410 [Puccinia striiformis f. sp. tritici PST-130]
MMAAQRPPYLTPLHADSSQRLSAKQLAALAVLQDRFDVDKDKLQVIVNQFQNEFKIGLENVLQIKTPNNAKSVASSSSEDQKHQPNNNNSTSKPCQVNLPMLPTFIHDVPNGDEQGLFLALDLGGTNLRVCEVRLNGDKTFSIKSDKYLLSDEIKTGTAEELFDYIADCVQAFLVQLGHVISEDEKLHLGFTFSFPVLQSALAEGKLMDWTKGFKATGAIGHDIVKLLQNSFDKKKVLVHCNALVNDTTGTLMARAYQSGSALVGAIFGTGTNAAYVERLSAVKKLDGHQSPTFDKADKMIINTEWGAFDNSRNVLPVTKYDNKLDRESINPRKQAFEKMVSGMYLGELTRNVLIDMIDEGVLFEGHSSEKLNQHYGFDTALMSQIDGGGCLSQTGKGREEHLRKIEDVIRGQFDIVDRAVGTSADWIVIRRVCEIVATRAARLSAAAIATVIKQTEADSASSLATDQKISIGVDGSLIERYENFIDRLKRGLKDLFDDQVYAKIEIELAKDGSGVGAALCALQAKKQEDELSNLAKVQSISI